jgi:DNA polymerase (family 10)
MPTTNAKVAALLRQFATALKLQRAGRFKVKAYLRAAETIEATSKNVEHLAANGESLEALPGIGKAISANIQEIVKTGRLSQLERAAANLPPELLELSERPLLDPSSVKRVYKKLGIKSLAELKAKLNAGEIGKVLGTRLEHHVRQGLDDRPRILHWATNDFVSQFKAFISSLPEVTRVEVTGSYRRKKDTVGDLNFLVASKNATSICHRVAEFPGVLSSEKVVLKEARFKLSLGRTITLRFAPLRQWGFSLLETTGSKAHLKQLNDRFRKKRITLSSSALGKRAEQEETVYQVVGLPYIEPELREGRGEIEAAATGKLPKLVELKDIAGDLHMHTTASDGVNSILEMANAAKDKGYTYVAIADHSQSLKITNGLTPKRLLAQCRAIDKVNSRLKGIRVLKSAEVDILEDGTLDYPDAVLKELDLTICSIHSKFSLDKNEQTERLMRAMDSRYFNILGHATGRLLYDEPAMSSTWSDY